MSARLLAGKIRPAPATWVFAAAIAFSMYLLILQNYRLADVSWVGWVIAISLMTIYTLPLGFLVSALGLRRTERTGVALAALVWGSVAATIFSVYASHGWGLVVADIGGARFAASWSGTVTGPIVEEVLKACGLMLLCMMARNAFHDLMDGWVYGAIIGLGFALMEDIVYLAGLFAGQPSGLLRAFFLRLITGGAYSHLFFTAVSGAGIAYFVTRAGSQRLAKRSTVAVASVLGAVGLHYLWNSPTFPFFPQGAMDARWWLTAAAVSAAALVPFVAMIWISMRLMDERHGRWMRLALLFEDAEPLGITKSEAEVLKMMRSRRRERRRLREVSGRTARQLALRMQTEQLQLAMMLAEPAVFSDREVAGQRDLCVTLREALHVASGTAPETVPAR